jgi:hypothetical protein
LLTPEVPGNFGAIRDLRALAFNGSAYLYRGIDFSSSYQMVLSDASSLNFRLLATKMLEQSFQPTPTLPYVDVVGQTGTSNSFLSDNQPSAEWIANFSTTYIRGAATVTGQMRYVSDGIMNWRGVTPNDPGYPTVPAGGATLDRNKVASYAIFALSGSYTFEDLGAFNSLQLFGVVNNLFDKDPPIATGTGFGGAQNGGTNAVFYDTMGRSFRLGARINF